MFEKKFKGEQYQYLLKAENNIFFLSGQGELTKVGKFPGSSKYHSFVISSGIKKNTRLRSTCQQQICIYKQNFINLLNTLLHVSKNCFGVKKTVIYYIF